MALCAVFGCVRALTLRVRVPVCMAYSQRATCCQQTKCNVYDYAHKHTGAHVLSVIVYIHIITLITQMHIYMYAYEGHAVDVHVRTH